MVDSLIFTFSMLYCLFGGATAYLGGGGAYLGGASDNLVGENKANSLQFS